MGKLQEFYEAQRITNPFSEREERTLSKQDKYFIRDIQFIEKVDKNKAIEIFRNYKKSSIEVRKRYREKIDLSLMDSPKDKTSFHIDSLTREQKELLPYIKPDIEKQKQQEIEEEKSAKRKLDKIYAYLHAGRYIPLQGDSRHYYDVETDTIVTRHAYMRGIKEAGIINNLPRFGNFKTLEQRREERKRELFRREQEKPEE